MYCAAMGSIDDDVSSPTSVATSGVAAAVAITACSGSSPDSNCRIRSSRLAFASSSSLAPSLVKALACCAAISNLLATVASPKFAIASLYILFLFICAKARGLTPSIATSSSSIGASKVLRSPSAASPASSLPFAKESSSAGELKFKESINFCSSFVKPVSGSTLFLSFSWCFCLANLAFMAPVSVPSDKGTVVATFFHLRGFKLIGSMFDAGTSYELSSEPSKLPSEEAFSDSSTAGSSAPCSCSCSCSSSSSLEAKTESSKSTDAKASAASFALSSSMDPFNWSNMICSSGETPMAPVFLFAFSAFLLDLASSSPICALISSKASMRFINSISSGILPANRMASAFAFALAALLSRASCSFSALAASKASFSSSSCRCTALLCSSIFAALANSFFAALKSISSPSSEEEEEEDFFFAASFCSSSKTFASSACAKISSISSRCALAEASSSSVNGSGWSGMFSRSSDSSTTTSSSCCGTSNSTTTLCSSPSASAINFRALLLCEDFLPVGCNAFFAALISPFSRRVWRSICV